MIYKLLINICFFLFIVFHSNAQNTLLINGTTESRNNGEVVVLETYSPSFFYYPVKIIKKESIVRNGKFIFKIETDSTEIYRLFLKKDEQKQQYFLLAPKITDITFKDSLFKDYLIEGNPIHQNYKDLLKKIDRGLFTPKEIEENVRAHVKDRGMALLPFILVDPVSHIADSTMLSLAKKIPDSLRKNSASKELDYIVDHLQIGTYLSNFVQLDTNGHKIQLSDFKGKYVLLEFWASWCEPCRLQNPHLKEMYKRNKNENFEIINFSLDHDRSAWLRAIKEDGIQMMKHVSNLEKQNEVALKKFKAVSIPINFLIDPNGVIIGKNLWRADLEEKLRDIFNDK